jgi:hypothetical protein
MKGKRAMGNHFDSTVAAVQSAPQNQRAERIITSITEQMQASSSQQVQQLGDELKEVQPKLIKAMQQGG